MDMDEKEFRQQYMQTPVRRSESCVNCEQHYKQRIAELEANSVPFVVMCKNCKYKFCKGHRVLGSVKPKDCSLIPEGE
jgi:hypothetical protein